MDLAQPFDLPAPALILVGAGTQSLPDLMPARAAFCSPLTALRLEVAEQRARLFGVPLFFVSAGRGLVAPDAMVSGGEPLLADEELMIKTEEILVNQLDKMNTSIVELHASLLVSAMVASALQASGEPHLISTPRLDDPALSNVFRAYKEAVRKLR